MTKVAIRLLHLQSKTEQFWAPLIEVIGYFLRLRGCLRHSHQHHYHHCYCHYRWCWLSWPVFCFFCHYLFFSFLSAACGDPWGHLRRIPRGKPPDALEPLVPEASCPHPAAFHCLRLQNIVKTRCGLLDEGVCFHGGAFVSQLPLEDATKMIASPLKPDTQCVVNSTAVLSVCTWARVFDWSCNSFLSSSCTWAEWSMSLLCLTGH